MLFFEAAAGKNHSSGSIQSPIKKGHRVVIMWLLICCALIFAMVVLGGVTRLTQSGLSMVNWKPIMGVIPPLSEFEWNQAFNQYKQFPEFQFVNQDMTLAGFKSIYLVEWAHRVLGRLIGICFFVPFVFFVLRGMIDRTVIGKLLFIFLLGGLQGLMGWYMVKSGLVDNPHVSQYRLAAHLSLAVLIYGLIFWVALDLIASRVKPAKGENRFAFLLLVLVSVMIISGAFVAGTRAGFIMNTFPTMHGQWLPDGLFVGSPIWRDLFENTVTIQFIHRCGALLVFVSVVYFFVREIMRGVVAKKQLAVWLLLGATLLQIFLGISTLLMRVPIVLGAAHQGGALLLFTAAIFTFHIYSRSE